MKFTSGFWQMRPGVTSCYATEVHDVEANDRSLTVHTATRPIHHRGDTLNQALLTARFSSPMPGVIQVQLYHFKGVKPHQPEFVIQERSDFPVSVQSDGAEAACLTSGDLTVRVERQGGWKVEFLAGAKRLTGSGWRCAGFIDAPERRFIHESLGLSVGEYVYGLGERFTPFVKNGQVVDMWNEDGGTSSEIAYKNVPFYLTNRGYGVLVNHPECVSFEVGSEKVERVQFSVPGEYLEYFVIYGPTPRPVLERYTALTGRPGWLLIRFSGTEPILRFTLKLLMGIVSRQSWMTVCV